MDPENAFPFRVLRFNGTQIRQQTSGFFFPIAYSEDQEKLIMANFLQQTNPVMHWKLVSHRPLDRIVIDAQLDAC
jgi:hypothetical protein